MLFLQNVCFIVAGVAILPYHAMPLTRVRAMRDVLLDMRSADGGGAVSATRVVGCVLCCTVTSVGRRRVARVRL